MSNEIPEIVKPLISQRALETIAKVRKFVEEDCIPADKVYHSQLKTDPSERWKYIPPIMEQLKAKAKAQGLWNLFLPSRYSEGAGFTNLEYGLMCEQMGRCHTAPEAMNCGAPDTGNMEVFAKYANEAQKKEWLQPLLEGKIRSAFCMTERFVASSDARNIQLNMTIDEEKDEYVLNGTKWWASGAGDPRCAVWLVMGRVTTKDGKCTTGSDPYRQQSVLIVPANAPGSKVVRPMTVYGFDDAPHGHCEIQFTNCRVPRKNIVLGEGRGFEIIQGRLGPGRIHHCMRLIGSAEQALRWMIFRVTDENRKTFGKMLKDHGSINADVAKSRIDIDYARLLVLSAAHKMDTDGPKAAMVEIAKAKISAPNVALAVIDRAIQAFGAEGISQDTPLARMYANNRTLRIADGPDEVHIFQLGRKELEKANKVKADMEFWKKREHEFAVKNKL